MTQSDVTVILDDRVRVISSVLAVTNFPQKSQERKRYHAHPYARASLKRFAEMGLESHVAVKGMQTMLDKGITLEQLFGVAFDCDFPTMTLKTTAPSWLVEGWTKDVARFYEDAKLKEWWSGVPHDRSWEDAFTQAKRIFEKSSFKKFLKPFFGDIQEELIVMPNIGYPADGEVGIRKPSQLISLVPPPLAWGESNPWPYDEETNITLSYRAALSQYCRVLLDEYLDANPEKVKEAMKKDLPVTGQLRDRYTTWREQFSALFISGAVSIYFEEYFSKPEADAFELMERKVRGMTLLSATISVMRRYMNEHGNRYQSLADFLTIFPTQLRVAKKIVGR
jgi:hypothetical protein